MINIGILGCADIAFRRFLPELVKNKEYKCIAIAEEYDKKKLERFQQKFQIESRDKFDDIIKDPNIDAVYVPLPPALHYENAKLALENGKHVFVEKPSTTEYTKTVELVEIAKEKKLVLQENYMFQYHSQIKRILKIIDSEDLGELRLIRCNFSFPARNKGDFRYSQKMGGGALLDAAGYVTKLATILLGDSIRVETAALNYLPQYEVDLYGSVTFVNERGLTVQAAFGMDNYYQCNLEVMGSRGKLSTDRIFTAPADLKPVIVIEHANEKDMLKMECDSHFAHSIEEFAMATKSDIIRQCMYKDMLLQSKLIQEIREQAHIFRI